MSNHTSGYYPIASRFPSRQQSPADGETLQEILVVKAACRAGSFLNPAVIKPDDPARISISVGSLESIPGPQSHLALLCLEIEAVEYRAGIEAGLCDCLRTVLTDIMMESITGILSGKAILARISLLDRVEIQFRIGFR